MYFIFFNDFVYLDVNFNIKFNEFNSKFKRVDFIFNDVIMNI